MCPLVFGLINKHLVGLELDTNNIAEMKNPISDGFRSDLIKSDVWLLPTMIVTAMDQWYIKHVINGIFGD